MRPVPQVIERIRRITPGKGADAVLSAAESGEFGIFQAFVPHDVLQIFMGIVHSGVDDRNDDFL